MTNKHQSVAVQYAMAIDGIPGEDAIRQWVLLALPEHKKDAELTVRVVDEAEITALNRHYRGKDGATNVLSFPYEGISAVETRLLGDIVICAPVVASEAIAQDKPLDGHWAHIVVHGVLHLLGYDHEHDEAAHEMESRETELLSALGYSNPY
jgi:probable rRNA maturation factor